MQYAHVRPAEFLARPNRFVARVLLDGKEETVHVKNTGRCRGQGSIWPKGTTLPARPGTIWWRWKKGSCW